MCDSHVNILQKSLWKDCHKSDGALEWFSFDFGWW